MRVVDLFCGGGGFSCGATQAGAEVVLSVEWDAKIAAIYKANFPPGERHEVRVEELGGDPESMASEIRAMIKEDEEPLHVHGSPPCQKLSNISMQRMNVAEGMRLVRWFLDVVEASKPPSWTMEQVPHPKLLEYLTQRGIAWHVVTASGPWCTSETTESHRWHPRDHCCATTCRRFGSYCCAPTLLSRSTASRTISTAKRHRQSVAVRWRVSKILAGRGHAQLGRTVPHYTKRQAVNVFASMTLRPKIFFVKLHTESAPHCRVFQTTLNSPPREVASSKQEPC